MSKQANIQKVTKAGNNKLYHSDSDRATEKSESLKKDLALAIHLISENQGKINLKDAESVRESCLNYLNLCLTYNIPPNFITYCCTIGHSRQALYQFMARNPNTETTELLNLLRGIIGGIILSQAEQKNFDNATSIFLLKNSNLGFKDSPTEVFVDATVQTNEERDRKAAAYKTMFQNESD